MGEFDGMFVFLEAGSDPAVDRVTVEHAGERTLFVWVPDAPAAARVAAEQAEAGIGIIELYRGFDLGSAAQVIEAAGGRAPVGVTGYGFGAAPSRIGHSATIFLAPDVDPATDRVVREHDGGGRTTVVAVPDEPSVVRVAAELADQGVDLIEVCGGTALTVAHRAQEAAGGRAQIGLVTYAFESLDGVVAYKAAFEAAHGRP